MENEILKIISDATRVNIKEIKKNIDSNNIWDSLIYIELIISLEDNFNISFDESEIDQMKTPRKVIKCVSGKI